MPRPRTPLNSAKPSPKGHAPDHVTHLTDHDRNRGEYRLGKDLFENYDLVDRPSSGSGNSCARCARRELPLLARRSPGCWWPHGSGGCPPTAPDRTARGDVPQRVWGVRTLHWHVELRRSRTLDLQGMIARCGIATAVPDLRPARWLVGSARPVLRGQGRRTAGTAARGRRAATNQPRSAAGVGRSCGARRVRSPTPPVAARAPVGDTGNHRAMASTPDRAEAGLSEPHRQTAGRRHHHGVVYRLVRRCLLRHRHSGREDPTIVPVSQRPRRTVRRDRPTRSHRPTADHQRTPPADGAGPLRIPLQPPQAPPGTSARTTTTGQASSRAEPHVDTSPTSPRRPNQRVRTRSRLTAGQTTWPTIGTPQGQTFVETHAETRTTPRRHDARHRREAH